MLLKTCVVVGMDIEEIEFPPSFLNIENRADVFGHFEDFEPRSKNFNKVEFLNKESL